MCKRWLAITLMCAVKDHVSTLDKLDSIKATCLINLIQLRLYVKFSLRLTGSAMFDATFNMVTRVGVPQFLEH